MILGVIPARLNSTRFPSNVIFPLKGKPIIEHVYEKALQSNLLNKVIVAVDSEETKNVINCQNIIMTSDKHQSGTDRVAEVAKNFNCDIVVNIQGDEPIIKEHDIQKAIDAKIKNNNKVINCFTSVYENDAISHNTIKMVMKENSDLMYASRSSIVSLSVLAVTDSMNAVVSLRVYCAPFRYPYMLKRKRFDVNASSIAFSINSYNSSVRLIFITGIFLLSNILQRRCTHQLFAHQ